MSTSEMSPRARRIFSRVFPWVFVISGAIFLYLSGRDFLMGKASKDWPTVDGIVLSSSAVRRDSSGSGSGPNRTGPSTTYRAEVVYQFSINGTTLTGDRFAFGYTPSEDPTVAQRIVDEYPKGKNVTVYYRPDNPEECVLQPGLTAPGWWRWPVMGLCSFILGCVLVLYLPKMICRDSPKTEKSLS